MHASEKNIYLILLIVSAGIGLVLIYFFVILIRQHRMLKQTHKESIQNLLNAVEWERKRISNDLHDEVNPILAAIKHQLELLSKTTSDKPVVLTEVTELLKDAMISLTAISNDLMPVMLLRNKLTAAIKQYLASIHKGRELQIRFSTSIEDEIDQEISVHLFRIIQETVQNTIKHAFANTMHIQLDAASGYLTLNIVDDGKGFDLKDRQLQQNGKGMRSIRLRVKLFDGTCSIHSAPDQGTSYTIKLPYTKHKIMRTFLYD